MMLINKTNKSPGHVGLNNEFYELFAEELHVCYQRAYK